MSAVLHPVGTPQWREPGDSRHWTAAMLAALTVEAALLAGVAWVLVRPRPPQPLKPIQIVLEAPKPAPQTHAPRPPQVTPPTPVPPRPVVKPTPKPVPKPRPHHVVRHPPRPHVQRPQPAPPPPAPVPRMQPPPAPVADTKPAMPVAPPAPPAPPPPQPVAPAPDVASIRDAFAAALRSAIQAAVRYPSAARMMQLTGEAEIAFAYRNGTVTDVRVVQSAGSELLDRAAMAAVRDAVLPITPKTLLGRSMAFQVWVKFHLDNA